MKEQSSFRKRAKFSQRILRSGRRILQSPMPTKHSEGGYGYPLCGQTAIHGTAFIHWMVVYDASSEWCYIIFEQPGCGV